MNGFWKTPIHSCRINWKCSFPTMPTPWIFQHWAVKISTLYKIKMSAVLADLPVAWLKSTGWPFNRNPCSVLVHFSPAARHSISICSSAVQCCGWIPSAFRRKPVQSGTAVSWFPWSMVWICGNWMPACTTNWKKKHSSMLGGTVFSRLKS